MENFINNIHSEFVHFIRSIRNKEKFEQNSRKISIAITLKRNRVKTNSRTYLPTGNERVEAICHRTIKLFSYRFSRTFLLFANKNFTIVATKTAKHFIKQVRLHISPTFDAVVSILLFFR